MSPAQRVQTWRLATCALRPACQRGGAYRGEKEVRTVELYCNTRVILWGSRGYGERENFQKPWLLPQARPTGYIWLMFQFLLVRTTLQSC